MITKQTLKCPFVIITIVGAIISLSNAQKNKTYTSNKQRDHTENPSQAVIDQLKKEKEALATNFTIGLCFACGAIVILALVIAALIYLLHSFKSSEKARAKSILKLKNESMYYPASVMPTAQLAPSATNVVRRTSGTPGDSKVSLKIPRQQTPVTQMQTENPVKSSAPSKESNLPPINIPSSALAPPPKLKKVTPKPVTTHDTSRRSILSRNSKFPPGGKTKKCGDHIVKKSISEEESLYEEIAAYPFR